MANWSVLRGAWVGLTELLSLEMQKIDTFLTKVPNFMDGSSHNSAAQVQLGGAGLKLNGTTALEINGTATWDNAAHAHFQAGSFLTVDANAFIAFNGHASITADWFFNSGNTSTWDPSTHVTFNGPVDVNAVIGLNASSTVLIAGTTTFGATSTTNLLSGAVFEFGSGSHLNFDGGSFISVAASTTFDLFSTMTVRSTGSIDVRSGASITVEGDISVGTGTITVGSGGAIVYSGGSVTGTKTDSSTETRTGTLELSGNNAGVNWRLIAFDATSGRPNGDQNASFDVWKWDYIVASNLTTGRTWGLTAPPASGQRRVTIENPTGSNLTITTVIGSVVLSGGDKGVFVYSNGNNGVATGWRLSA